MKDKNKKRRIKPVKLKLKLSKNSFNSPETSHNPSLRIKLTTKQYDTKQEKDNISDIKQQMLSYLKKHSKTERNILAPFNTVPSRKLYPDYYLTIKDPESIKGIQEKITNNTIKSKQELIDRYILLFEKKTILLICLPPLY